MKKKFIFFLISLVCIWLLFFTIFTSGKTTFRGEISQINGDSAIVLDAKGGRIRVDLSVNKAVKFQIGDEIVVGFLWGNERVRSRPDKYSFCKFA